MTILDDAPTTAAPADAAPIPVEERLLGGLTDSEAAPPTSPGSIPSDSDPASDERAPLNALTVAGACFLTACGAGWMLAGVFSGILPEMAAVAGAAIGAGTTGLAHRRGRSGFLQYLTVPLALLAGAVLVAPDATGGTANLPSLVVEALRSGGFRTPPVPFDPGWRILLVLLTTLLGAASVSIAIGFDRAKIGASLAAPVIAAAVLVQPRGQEFAPVAVALVLVGAGLSIAYGAELARDGVTSGRFELRRLGRGAMFMVLLVAAVAGLSRLGVLFPEPKDQTVPPQRPTPSPPLSDRVLFTVETPRNIPFRLGVLDVYDGKGWLTPPFTPATLIKLDETDGVVPPSAFTVSTDEPMSVDFDMRDLPGRAIPVPASPLNVKGVKGVDFDPRSQVMRLGGRIRSGTDYTVQAPEPPDTRDLLASGAPGPALAEYLTVPEAPFEIADVIASIPAGLPQYERLQFVRTKLYSSVVAAGAGDPADVTPARAAELLVPDTEASPYEIVATEALLARWTGVPSRIGYGWYIANPEPGKTKFEIRPKHGAMWAEVWFEGHGWVPFVGRPPRAKASLTPDQVTDAPDVTSTDEVALEIHVPFRLTGVQLLFELIRYWLVRLLPLWIALAGAWVVAPGLAKVLRRPLRARWGRRLGPAGRVAVAYCDLRDACNDLGVGHPSMTPIELLDATVADKEHRELAWLVTRGLWGDLARDLRDADARAAEVMARSVRRRLWKGQAFVPRAIAFCARVSLRDPYSIEPPNPWPSWRPRARMAKMLQGLARLPVGAWRGLTRLRRSARQTPAPGTVLLVVVVAMAATLSSGCVRKLDLVGRPAGANLRLPSVPATLGPYRFQPEADVQLLYGQIRDEALIEEPRVFTVRKDDAVEGALEQAVLKRGLSARREAVRNGVLRTLGGSTAFKAQRLGDERVYLLKQASYRMLLQFSDDGLRYQVLTARSAWTDAEVVFVQLLRQQRGADAAGSTPAPAVQIFDDGRRGVE